MTFGYCPYPKLGDKICTEKKRVESLVKLIRQHTFVTDFKDEPFFECYVCGGFDYDCLAYKVILDEEVENGF